MVGPGLPQVSFGTVPHLDPGGAVCSLHSRLQTVVAYITYSLHVTIV